MDKVFNTLFKNHFNFLGQRGGHNSNSEIGVIEYGIEGVVSRDLVLLGQFVFVFVLKILPKLQVVFLFFSDSLFCRFGRFLCCHFFPYIEFSFGPANLALNACFCLLEMSEHSKIPLSITFVARIVKILSDSGQFLQIHLASFDKRLTN